MTAFGHALTLATALAALTMAALDSGAEPHKAGVPRSPLRQLPEEARH